MKTIKVLSAPKVSWDDYKVECEAELFGIGITRDNGNVYFVNPIAMRKLAKTHNVKAV